MNILMAMVAVKNATYVHHVNYGELGVIYANIANQKIKKKYMKKLKNIQ